MKKTFIEKKYNTVLVESYKKADEGAPTLGSFSVKGMTVENEKNQNGRIYSEACWQQPTSFGVGGAFIDESGKLRPTTLFGSLDHPLDDRAEFLGKESAIAWYETTRNQDGSWDGKADILPTPDGRIVKALLEYAKYRNSAGILGVSSRAVGESRISESQNESVEEIIPEGFQLMSFDFVINPSFKTAVARFNESKKTVGKALLESVKQLAVEDPEHAQVYTEFADGLKRGTEMAKPVKTENTEQPIVTPEVTPIVENTPEVKPVVKEAEEPKEEPKEEETPKEEPKEGEESEEEEKPEGEETEDEESEDEEPEEEPKEEAPVAKKLSDITVDEFRELMTSTFETFFGPVEDPSAETDLPEEEVDPENLEGEESEEDLPEEDVNEYLSSLTDEDIANASEEELAMIEKLAKESK